MIVVDNVWWLGKLKLINWLGHKVWRLVEYINVMYWLIVNMTNVYILCVCVWEEIWDVLHRLGEDRGWTSKPDIVWEEIGYGLHWYSSYACQIYVRIQLICLSMEVMIQLICLSLEVLIQLVCLSVEIWIQLVCLSVGKWYNKYVYLL